MFSATTGYFGMWLAVRGNVRVAAAARDSGEQQAMRIAFRTGGVAGMFTVGLGLFGAAVVVLVYKGEAPKVLEGFGFGAALLAMFMRVGGGIFTKAADVGADLVGKVESHIPEDDPRNAATIADNVGDNVGDCAGMAADLFESYAVTLVAALILGTTAFGSLGLVFPLIVPALGVITAVVGIFAVAPRAGDRSGMTAINRGFFISAALSAVLVVIAAYVFLPDRLTRITGIRLDALGLDVVRAESFNPRFLAIGAVLIGIVLAAAIQQLTGYFTETGRRPVDDIAKSALTGPATVILTGVSVGSRVGGLLRPADRRRGVRRVLAGRRVGRAEPVRDRPGRHRPADHGRGHRVHGHLRTCLGQRPGHRRDVRGRDRRGRGDPDQARRRGQHHQGDHQGHRDRDRGPGGHRPVRCVPRVGHDRRHRRGADRGRRPGATWPSSASTWASWTWPTRATSSAC